MAGATFDQLPPEVLHRILVVGPCSNAVALASVNKRLQTICANPMLYLAMMKSEDSFRIPGSKWWLLAELDLVQDYRTLTKWALAEQEAKYLFQMIAPSMPLIEGFWSWLPELLVAHHPTGFDLCEKHVWRNDFWSYDQRIGYKMNSGNEPRGDTMSNTYLDWISRIAFLGACTCAVSTRYQYFRSASPLQRTTSWGRGILSDYVSEPMASELTSFFSASKNWSSSLWGSSSFLDDAGIHPNTWATSQTQRCHWVRVMSFSTVMAGVLYRCLSLAFDGISGRITVHHTVPSTNLKPPSPRSIPFFTLAEEPPVPFSGSTEGGNQTYFLMNHLRQMTSADFLQQDEWCGYYCYTFRDQIPLWDSMMSGLRFEITSDSSDHCTIQASGRDRHGAFSLTGTVFKMTGWVKMNKQYNNAHSWQWSAMMTPFGIIGCWGAESGGFFWLWKRKWSLTQHSHEQLRHSELAPVD